MVEAENKPGVIHLKKMSKNTKDIILKKQYEDRVKCGCMRSIEWTIYNIIKEWQAFKQQSEFLIKQTT